MNAPPDLIKAIRTGQLSEVVTALESGATLELNDGQGNPGLPLAMACFMGFPEIVRELILRGATVNFQDNREPTSPLSMAVRGGKAEVVRVLVELGAEVPAGMQTGLSDQELMVARWKAQHFGAGRIAGQGTTEEFPVIEEIQVLGCYGTDTGVLDAEMRRAVEEMCKK